MPQSLPRQPPREPRRPGGAREEPAGAHNASAGPHRTPGGARRAPAGTRIRALTEHDPSLFEAAFAEIGWDKPASRYEAYLAEAAAGRRAVFVAEVVDGSGARFAGYGTVVWESDYAPFRDRGIPEIVDLNVLPSFRRQGIGSMILDAAERAIAERSEVAGIGVGLYPGYGAAQRMYVRRGYVPDGRGVCYDGAQVPAMQSVRNDDSLNLYFTKRLR